MRAVVRAVSLAALSLVLGAGLGGVAAAKPKHAGVVVSCPATSSPGSVVGTITNVLHSNVQVGTASVEVTPFDVVSGSHICTDSTGQAVFDLARSNKSVVCVALKETDVQVTPSSAYTANVQHGEAWCSIRRKDGPLTAPIGRLRLGATTQALVGIVVTSTTTVIKVVEGSIYLSTRQPARGTLTRNQQVSVSSSGRITPKKFALSSEEQVAIAQLKLAPPTSG